MKKTFLLGGNDGFTGYNIYADKSSLVLEWLLLIGVEKKEFSIREVSREKSLSVGIVQKVFKLLVLQGVLEITGVRTAKKFALKKPNVLLKNWTENYDITTRCRMRTYRSGFSNRQEIINLLKSSGLKDKLALALHSAAEELGYKNTNLQTLELYLLEPGIRPEIERALELEPQERGYEVLLIEPYYKAMLGEVTKKEERDFFYSSALLTFLDLYHFPLRGIEQAEHMASRDSEIKRVYNGF